MTIDEAKRELTLDNQILGMLKAQLKRAEAKSEKRLSDRQKKHQDVLGEYENEEQINEEYGWGFITERKRAALVKAWRNAHEPDDDIQDFIDWLKKEIHNTANTAREMEHIIRQGGDDS